MRENDDRNIKIANDHPQRRAANKVKKTGNKTEENKNTNKQTHKK